MDIKIFGENDFTMYGSALATSTVERNIKVSPISNIFTLDGLYGQISSTDIQCYLFAWFFFSFSEISF